ncbi:Sn1-specific diacylglycerol lipase alpha, partial [Armadillidium vulgare]
LILTLVLFYEHIRDSENIDPDGTSCKKGETLIRIYVIGVLVILSLSFLLSVTLAIHSAKGTIMTTAPRRYVPQILIFRVVFGVFEIGWNILGTLWLYSDQVQCEKNSAIWVLLEDVLASLFEESDLVASDIAAALVLLRLKKKYEEVLIQSDNTNANRNIRNAVSNFQTPFFVAIDDETKNVVVSIRGTLSLYDTITDLNAQSTLLVYDGLPSGCRAHKGMVNVAQFVKRKLDETNAIEEAMLRRDGYGLVITGHSLGAGAAVILSAMMRPLYPNLKCFAFSPPGGLCSLEMYTATQSFVMSVVVGDDLVPRLSIAAIHDLHNKTINVLNSCRKPKIFTKKGVLFSGKCPPVT